MRTIKDTFRDGGFDYQLIKRTNDIALLSKSKPHWQDASFEVVVIQKHEPFTLKGQTYEARESLPRSESWGSLGWTYSKRDDANAKFERLCLEGLNPSDLDQSNGN